MKVEISPSKLSGEIAAPPSKSYLHRLIIAAFLCGKEIIIHTGELSEDARATLGAVKSLGGSVEFGKGFVKVCGGGEKGAHGGANDCRESANDPVEVDCGESGSTLRFLMPVAAALGVRARFTGKGRLSSRPIKALADCMNAFKQTVDGREILSPLPAGDYEIEGSESSQYITGMLFALSCLGGGSLTVTGKEVSRGYVEITIDVLKKFGVRIEREKNVFKIKSGFNACENEFFTEGDWSGAAFPLCAAAEGDSLGGRIDCVITGVKGAGDNLFGGLEGKISQLLYAIPAVKGVEFGAGFDFAKMRGSEANDALYYDDEGEVKFRSFRAGGINGGIANGAPITFSVALRPTPSIYKEQETIDLIKKENVKIKIKGRHDACIVPRAVPCAESAAAIAIIDEIL